MSPRVSAIACSSLLLALACNPAPEPPAPTPAGVGGSGGSAGGRGARGGTGGAGGSGAGVNSTAGTSGGAAGGSAGGASPVSGGGGAPLPDAAPVANTDAAPDAAIGGPTDSAPATDTPGATPPATSQGPVAEGKIAFSQDFELNMDGMSRSPNNLPEDRIQIVDDPAMQRGKVVRIMFKDGDNFRTSPGTQPRSWFSAAKGYTVKPGTKVSVAWGFMWDNVNMNAHFAQLIREGGPTWMWDVDGSGNLSMTSHRGTGRTGNLMKLERMRWYDFMVTTDYRNGGEVTFYVDGKKVLTGTSPGGPDGRFDFGIYTRPGPHPARTVYISNVSIGEP